MKIKRHQIQPKLEAYQRFARVLMTGDAALSVVRNKLALQRAMHDTTLMRKELIEGIINEVPNWMELDKRREATCREYARKDPSGAPIVLHDKYQIDQTRLEKYVAEIAVLDAECPGFSLRCDAITERLHKLLHEEIEVAVEKIYTSDIQGMLTPETIEALVDEVVSKPVEKQRDEDR